MAVIGQDSGLFYMGKGDNQEGKWWNFGGWE